MDLGFEGPGRPDKALLSDSFSTEAHVLIPGSDTSIHLCIKIRKVLNKLVSLTQHMTKAEIKKASEIIKQLRDSSTYAKPLRRGGTANTLKRIGKSATIISTMRSTKRKKRR